MLTILSQFVLVRLNDEASLCGKSWKMETTRTISRWPVSIREIGCGLYTISIHFHMKSVYRLSMKSQKKIKSGCFTVV